MTAYQHRAAWALCLLPALAAAANTVQSRQISDMFYNDTLSKPVAPKTPPKKQQVASNKKAADPAPPVAPSRRKVGLKYRVQLRPGVDTDSARIFRSGESIRLVVESNIDGYLYVILRGSSGNETQLFPHPQINGGRNLVKAGTPYAVPATEGWFEFDANPGEEKLLLVVSRSPMDPSATKPAEVAQSVSYSTLMTQLNRTVQSRDLVFVKEEAPPAAAGAAPAQAVIWVNASETENQAVHATVVLQHR